MNPKSKGFKKLIKSITFEKNTSMKRIAITTVFSILLAVSSFSQLFFSAHRDRIILDFSADFWNNQPQGLEMESLNRTFNVTLFRDIRLNRNFAIGVGLGISGSNLYTNQIFEDSDNPSHWSGQVQSSGYNFKPVLNGFDLNLSKLFFGYFHLPVEVRYRNFHTPHLFRVSLGGRFGLLSSASTKVKLVNPNGIFGPGSQTQYSFQEIEVQNINKFQFGLTARVGYGRFGINAFLPLTPVFKDNEATDMRYFSVGISMFML